MPQLVIKALHVCYFFDPFSGSKLVQRYDALSQNKYDCSSKIISKIAKMLKLLSGKFGVFNSMSLRETPS